MNSSTTSIDSSRVFVFVSISETEYTMQFPTSLLPIAKQLAVNSRLNYLTVAFFSSKTILSFLKLTIVETLVSSYSTFKKMKRP